MYGPLQRCLSTFLYSSYPFAGVVDIVKTASVRKLFEQLIFACGSPYVSPQFEEQKKECTSSSEFHDNKRALSTCITLSTEIRVLNKAISTYNNWPGVKW
ncbi:hypothetical protein KP509_24G033600 [Ceratopteris richardii]|uniref:Uncharacterized protein n=1 Tax=Ceratopteris richardii TaxID=49495 RepID=A0A8T2RW69_CERRI|nr:hypothetical protein KP509_24G033600 [Ceratopteris richardii]